MNERLELLRKRIRGTEQKRDSINWKALWIGSPTAWLALLISSCLAYNTLFNQFDDVSVVLTEPVSMTQVGGVDQKAINLPSSLTIVNSGTQPFVLLGAFVMVGPINSDRPASASAPQNRTQCNDRSNGHYQVFSGFHFERAIIAAGDVFLLPLKRDEGTLLQAQWSPQTELCIVFDFVVPHSAPTRRGIPVPVAEWVPEGELLSRVQRGVSRSDLQYLIRNRPFDWLRNVN